MTWDLAITAFATLFVMIDPIGLTPLFVALTAGRNAGERRAIALRAVVIAFVILAAFTLVGRGLLSGIGISIAALRIAGGLLLFLISVDMLFEKRSERREARVEAMPDPSVFPLALPLVAGPGAIAAVLVISADQAGNWLASATLLGVIIAVLVIVFVFFMAAGVVERILGQTGVNVITRVFGMLLAGLAVQFVLDGLVDSGLVSVGS